MARTWE